MRSEVNREATIKTTKRGGWTRVFAEESGRDASHLSYGPRELQVGPEGTVRLAAIGGVSTDREFRRRGLAGQVFARAMEEIRREGYSCVGLYTSTRIVAHRMYRRFGLVDVGRSPRGYKLLDPGSVVCDTLNHVLRDDSEGSKPIVLRVTLRPHEPIFVRIEAGAARPVRRPRREADVSLEMSSHTFIALRQGEMALPYAEGAKLVEWGGNEAHIRWLAEALARHHSTVNGG
jgi:hypothetical protein